jgi:hypothetical protein
MASAFVVATPRMFPIKQLLLTFAASKLEPIQITLSAEMIPPPASLPMAILRLPVVLLASASSPTAVLKLPLVLRKSAKWPRAELLVPLLIVSASSPMAVFSRPVVLALSALVPDGGVAHAVCVGQQVHQRRRAGHRTAPGRVC